MKIVFCHGLESGPFGRKYHAMVDAGLDVTSPDCQGKVLAERVDLVEALLRELGGPLVLVGSSYGGITAVLASMRVHQEVAIQGIVLCAPALERDEPPANETTLQKVAPTVIIHATGDEVIPIAVSRRYSDQHDARLVEVYGDHSLRGSLDVIIAEVRAFLE